MHHHDFVDRGLTNLEPVGSQFQKWLDKRSDRNFYASKGKKIPRFFVTAQGGGLYAAYHTASLLANIQDWCPLFASHIFAISSVSGGSVGASVFTELIKSRNPIPPEPVCLTGDKFEATNAMFMKSFFRNDFTSPLVRQALFGDVVNAVLPTRLTAVDRSETLRREFDAAWAASAARGRAGIERRSPSTRHISIIGAQIRRHQLLWLMRSRNILEGWLLFPLLGSRHFGSPL
jgi:hypothetical protein